jgi:hypothetical protein
VAATAHHEAVVLAGPVRAGLVLAGPDVAGPVVGDLVVAGPVLAASVAGDLVVADPVLAGSVVAGGSVVSGRLKLGQLAGSWRTAK